MDPEVTKDLLIKFYNNECNEREAAEVFLFLSKYPSSEEAKNLLAGKWEQSKSLDRPDSNLDEIYSEILLKIEQRTPPFIYSEQRRSRIEFYKYFRIAASVVLLLLSVFTIDYFMDKPKPAQVADIVLAAEQGKKLRVSLPDGSRVILNSESELKYPETFSGSNRVVFLSGEAYFEVFQDKEKPFIVKTENVSATALGTAFNVKSLRSSREVVVSLTEGSVLVNRKESVSGYDQNYTLNPGEQITLNLKDQKIEISRFNYKRSVGWKEGYLIFIDADIEELKSRLERWYGVQITFKNKPDKNWKFTSEYNNETLENVLKGIQYLKDIEYTVDSKNVEVSFKQENNYER